MTQPRSAGRAYARAARYELIHRGDGPVVLLLHGLGGDRSQPLGLTADHFGSTGLTILAPDARAHGQTSLIGGPASFTSAALAGDVIALVDELNLDDRPLIPIGISMGAAVALQLLEQQPERIETTVLIRPSFGPQPWLPHQRVFRLIASLLRSDGSRGLEPFRRSAELAHVRMVSATAARSLEEQFTKPLSTERVVRLETVPGNTAVDWCGSHDLGRPITIVGAEQDPGHPLEIAQLWHRRLRGSRLEIVPSRDTQPARYAADLARITTDAVDVTRKARA